MKPIRLAFAAYAVALFTGTHWPNLKVEGPVPRSDLWVHLTAFGTWCVLVTLCGFFGRWSSRRNLVLCWLLALGYACIDEGLQGIPALGRTCAWDDLGCNALGITIATLAMALIGRQILPAIPTPPLPETRGDGR